MLPDSGIDVDVFSLMIILHSVHQAHLLFLLTFRITFARSCDVEAFLVSTSLVALLIDTFTIQETSGIPSNRDSEVKVSQSSD